MSECAELARADDAGFGEFFAPCSTDLIDSIIAEYRGDRSKMERVSSFMSGRDCAETLDIFAEGNCPPDRYNNTPPLGNLFSLEGGFAALNSRYWSKALALTDVLDCMPEARRKEWFALIKERKAPAFEETTVRDTLAGLLSSRAQFMAERVDGIFRNLSGQHLTNSPMGFGQRMILYYIDSSYNDRTGCINDLRCVVAKLQGRPEPKYYVTSRAIQMIKRRTGEWHDLDGGAVRIRVYKKGTAHLEVHPDIAWQLNRILAHLYPMAIPSEFRQPPKRKAKDIRLMQRPLPDAVLGILGNMEPATKRVTEGFREGRVTIENAYSFRYVAESDKFAMDEAKRVLEAIGGVPILFGNAFQFDYPAGGVISDIAISGCIPDHKSHQYYPTPERLVRIAVELACIGDSDKVLEPSAGQGGIADHLPKDRTSCVEISALHCQILAAKGFDAVEADFIKWADGRRAEFDAVVMNPPFSDGRWQAHVEAAAQLVKSGGRLVAILPSGAVSRLSLPKEWACEWSRQYDGEFAGASVSVVILSAKRK